MLDWSGETDPDGRLASRLFDTWERLPERRKAQLSMAVLDTVSRSANPALAGRVYEETKGPYWFLAWLGLRRFRRQDVVLDREHLRRMKSPRQCSMAAWTINGWKAPRDEAVLLRLVRYLSLSPNYRRQAALIRKEVMARRAQRRAQKKSN
jgi:hypothetical protein